MSQTVYLAHHGIKGQKWGVRRFQNKDGSLTPAGRKRVASRYEELIGRFEKDQEREWSSRYVDSHNKAVDDANRKIDKLGKNADDDDMIAYYEKQLDKYMNKSLSELYSSNKNLQEARALAKKYNMVDWDDLAKAHEKGITDFEKRTGNKVKQQNVDINNPFKKRK